MTSLQKRPERTLPLRDIVPPAASPIAAVSANLMPPEVVAGRRLAWLRRRLAFGLVAVVLLVGLGYLLVRQQTAGATDDLSSEQQRGAGLAQQIRGYSEIVRIQGEVAQNKTKLASVMGNDTQWSTLLARLNRSAPAGLVVNQVDGEVLDPTAAAQTTPDPSTYNPGGQQVVGTLSASGTARDYKSVATYVEARGRTRGFVEVDPDNVATADGKTTFTVTMKLTRAVLGGRFSGGK